MIPIVHLPKTIDNDYHGIDFTFGFFTAVEFIASEIRNLIYDAEVTKVYFIAETMGRSAGWLSYGAAIAGEASLVISVEDIMADYLVSESFTSTGKVCHASSDGYGSGGETYRQNDARPRSGGQRIRSHCSGRRTRRIFAVCLCRRCISRRTRSYFHFGSQPVWHFFAWFPRPSRLPPVENEKSKVFSWDTSRAAKPHAFDVMLGSQLGVGAFRALAEKNLNGVMVSVSGQLDLHFEPFENLVDPETLITVVRYIEPTSDFHRLARFLETHVND